MRPCSVVRSAGENEGKFCDMAIHLRFWASLMPFQADASGASAVCWAGVNSTQREPVDAFGTTFGGSFEAGTWGDWEWAGGAAHSELRTAKARINAAENDRTGSAPADELDTYMPDAWSISLGPAQP